MSSISAKIALAKVIAMHGLIQLFLVGVLVCSYFVTLCLLTSFVPGHTIDSLKVVLIPTNLRTCEKDKYG